MRYHVTISAPEAHAILDLQGTRQALENWPAIASWDFPVTPNTASVTGPVAVFWTGQQHWIARTNRAQEHLFDQICSAENTPDTVSAVRLSDAYSFFSIQGRDAHQVMSIASPLDVHASVFPDNGASFTEAFGLKALVIKISDGFELCVERSYTAMVADCLQRAVG